MNNRKKNILLGVLVVGVIGMTVAFAALTTRLNISGTANVASANWNIHFQNWALDTSSTVTVGGNTQQNTAVYPQVNQLTMSASPNITKVEGINVTLYQPNDYVKYTFQIKNDGTIDGELTNFQRNITCTGNNCEEVVDYTVACTDASENDALASNYVLRADTYVSCYLQIKYKDVDNVARSRSNKVAANVAGTNQRYEQSGFTLTASPTWSWVQTTASANNQGSGGNSGGGGNTPSQYETTFNGTYGYDFTGAATSGSEDGAPEWVSTLDPEVRAYLRHSNSLEEVCGVFGSGQAGTVCMTSNYYVNGYSTDFAFESDFEDCFESEQSYDSSNTCIKGYIKAKADEMMAKGATNCEVANQAITCSNSSLWCNISSTGNAACSTGGDTWTVDYYGDANGHVSD